MKNPKLTTILLLVFTFSLLAIALNAQQAKKKESKPVPSIPCKDIPCEAVQMGASTYIPYANKSLTKGQTISKSFDRNQGDLKISAKDGKFTFAGTMKNLGQNQYFYIKDQSGLRKIGSIKNGAFSFSGVAAKGDFHIFVAPDQQLR